MSAHGLLLILLISNANWDHVINRVKTIFKVRLSLIWFKFSLEDYFIPLLTLAAAFKLLTMLIVSYYWYINFFAWNEQHRLQKLHATTLSKIKLHCLNQPWTLPQLSKTCILYLPMYCYCVLTCNLYQEPCLSPAHLQKTISSINFRGKYLFQLKLITTNNSLQICFFNVTSQYMQQLSFLLPVCPWVFLWKKGHQLYGEDLWWAIFSNFFHSV